MQPIFQVIGTQVAAVVFKIDDHGELVERKQIIRFLVELFLQVYDIVTLEIDAGALTEEYIAPPIEGDNVAEAVFSEVFQQEVLDRHLAWAKLLESVLQLPVVEAEVFLIRFAAHSAEVHHLLSPPDGMAQFIDLGVHVHDIYVGVVNPGFDEDLVGPLFKYQKADFTYCVKIGVAAVNVAVL